MADELEVSTTDEQVEGSGTVYDADWLSANRTSAAEQENKKWAEGRNQDIEASSRLKAALSSNPGIYDEYAKQIEAMDPAWKLELSNRHPDEIQAVLDDLAEDEKAQKRVEGELEKAEADRQEATRAAGETAGQSEHRKQFEQKSQEVAKLEEKIQELRRLNELRDDPTAEGWDKLSLEDWKLAREGNLDSKDAEIANLVQEKMSKLQESQMLQDAYYEANRANQPPPSQPIAQVNGNNVYRDDIKLLVRIERDEQDFVQSIPEAQKRYADWDQAFQSLANANMRPEHAAFALRFPNRIDVAYYLGKNPNEARALGQMSNDEAERTLMDISHKVRAPQEEPRKSNAPRPVSPVTGGRGRGDFDVTDENISADEWNRGRQAQLKRRNH